MWLIIFLMVCTVIDVKTRRIPVWLMVLGTMFAMVSRFFGGGEDTLIWIGGIIVGVFFLAVSKWTKEGMGYGDSWMILILGIYLGLWDVLLLVGIALSFSAVLALFLLVKGRWARNVAFPFIPFLMAGYVGVLWL